MESGRLRLVSAPGEEFADGADWSAVGSRVGASVPRNWPPELPDRPAWQGWYLVFKHPVDGSGVLAGALGSCPSTEPGVVEIGCVVLEQYRGRGLATEAVGLLIKLAFRDSATQVVAVDAFRDLIPWIAVATRNGMRSRGPGGEPQTIRLAIGRAEWRDSFPSIK